VPLEIVLAMKAFPREKLSSRGAEDRVALALDTSVAP